MWFNIQYQHRVTFGCKLTTGQQGAFTTKSHSVRISVYMYILITSQLARILAMSNIRWSVVVPEYTDRALRSYLARTGGRKGDLSRFVDEAVLSRLLELTVEDVKDRNVEYSQDEILAAIEDALAAG